LGESWWNWEDDFLWYFGERWWNCNGDFCVMIGGVLVELWRRFLCVICGAKLVELWRWCVCDEWGRFGGNVKMSCLWCVGRVGGIVKKIFVFYVWSKFCEIVNRVFVYDVWVELWRRCLCFMCGANLVELLIGCSYMICGWVLVELCRPCLCFMCGASLVEL
jgi:hypothetical protein